MGENCKGGSPGKSLAELKAFCHLNPDHFSGQSSLSASCYSLKALLPPRPWPHLLPLTSGSLHMPFPGPEQLCPLLPPSEHADTILPGSYAWIQGWSSPHVIMSFIGLVIAFLQRTKHGLNFVLWLISWWLASFPIRLQAWWGQNLSP